MPSQKNILMIDANVILRYLLKDDEELYTRSESLFSDVFFGRKQVVIIQAVLAEVVYVLQKLYKVSRREIAQVLTEFLNMEGVNVQDKSILIDALNIFGNKNLDFVDCILCAYSSTHRVVSFDDDVIKCAKNKSGEK